MWILLGYVYLTPIGGGKLAPEMIRRFSALPVPTATRIVMLLVIVLTGLALRVYKLDAQSFWYDEGNSARIAERSLQLIVEGAAGDIHPPLYYLVLHYW